MIHLHIKWHQEPPVILSVAVKGNPPVTGAIWCIREDTSHCWGTGTSPYYLLYNKGGHLAPQVYADSPQCNPTSLTPYPLFPWWLATISHACGPTLILLPPSYTNLQWPINLPVQHTGERGNWSTQGNKIKHMVTGSRWTPYKTAPEIRMKPWSLGQH